MTRTPIQDFELALAWIAASRAGNADAVAEAGPYTADDLAGLACALTVTANLFVDLLAKHSGGTPDEWIHTAATGLASHDAEHATPTQEPTPYDPTATAPMPGAASDNWLTLDEFADERQIPKRTIYAWRQRGEGPQMYRFGRHLRIKRSDATAYDETQHDTKYPPTPPVAP